MCTFGILTAAAATLNQTFLPLTVNVSEKLNVCACGSLTFVLLRQLASGRCSLCDAVVSIIKERLLPPFGCYVGQRRLSVDGRD